MQSNAFNASLDTLLCDSLHLPARGLALSQIAQMRAVKDNQSETHLNLIKVGNDLRAEPLT